MRRVLKAGMFIDQMILVGAVAVAQFGALRGSAATLS